MIARRTRTRAARNEPADAASNSADEHHGAGYSSPPCYLHELEPAAKPAPARGVQIKRIYDDPDDADGFRALVDRLWPRGVSKQRAALDAWLVELAPSNALRIWYGHDPRRWQEFGRRYRAELRAHAANLQELRRRAAKQRVTLLYGSREARINHAVVLREVLLTAHPRRLPARP
ncbi:MAG: DUF488 domain-containing protein [Steroidobacteraceae bacterium]